MREQDESARPNGGLPDDITHGVPSTGDLHRGGEHDRRRSHWRVRYESRELGSSVSNRPPTPRKEYPAILREYASSGFRDDPRDAIRAEEEK